MEPFPLGMGEYPYPALYRPDTGLIPNEWHSKHYSPILKAKKKKKKQLISSRAPEHGGALQHQWPTSCLDKHSALSTTNAAAPNQETLPILELQNANSAKLKLQEAV